MEEIRELTDWGLDVFGVADPLVRARVEGGTFVVAAALSCVTLVRAFFWIRRQLGGGTTPVTSGIAPASDPILSELIEERGGRREAERARDELDSRLAELKTELDAAAAEAAQADRWRRNCAEVEADLAELKESTTAEIRTLGSDRDRLAGRIDRITDLEGGLSGEPVADDGAPFVPKHRRRCRVIAVVNLKGGVGKTTVTANLGRALANAGEDTLLIDLDYQYTLSRLCFDRTAFFDLARAGATINGLFAPGDDYQRPFFGRVTRVGRSPLHCAVCTDGLEGIEEAAGRLWLAGQTDDDVRLRLRRAVHAPDVRDEFDYVLIDCPPRMTTATVNALAAADAVLVPAIVDRPSLEAVPRLLRRIRDLADGVGLCPAIELLGVVGNRAEYAERLSTAQLARWRSLASVLDPQWGAPVPLLGTHIPDKAEFGHAADENRFAADHPKLRGHFVALADEIRQQIAPHVGQYAR